MGRDAPSHHAGLKGDRGSEGGNDAALRVQQARQLVDQGHHLRPFADPHLLGNLSD